MMRMKPYLPLLLLLALSFQAQAQQPAQYSLYTLNPFGYNTAYAGLDQSLSATGVIRKQWVGFTGSPFTFAFNIHAPLDYLSSGIGLALERDALGAESNLSVQLAYNYFVPIGKTGRLSIGAAGRFWQKGIDGNKLRAPDGIYEGNTINHNDQYLPLGKVNGTALTADAGLYYRDERLQIGLAARNLSQPRLSWTDNNLQEVQMTRAYFLTASYLVDLNEDLSLQPSFLLKTDAHKWQPELTLIAQYKKQFFGGLGFRGYNQDTRSAVVILAGLQFAKHYTLGYSYDLSLSALRNFNSGSHELVLNYNLRQPLAKEIPEKIIYNPRYFQ
jgi:type IX secretion system PorP/SprF family membrane protein